MRLNRWLVVGIVAALGAGSIAYVVPLSASSDEPNASVTVPVGRIGDTVSGDDHWSEQGVQDCFPDPCDSWKGTGISKVTFRVNGTSRAVDRTGQERQGLEILSNYTYIQEEPGGVSERSAEGHSYLDLGTRGRYRMDVPYPTRGRCVVPGNPLDGSCPYSGPYSGYAVPGRDTISSIWSPERGDARFRFQGRTYSTGQDVTTEISPATFGRGDVLKAGSETELREGVNLTYRSWVGKRALVDGHDAVAVHSELRMSQSGTTREGYTFHETDLFWHVAWISSDVAYPVRVEYSNDWKWDGAHGSAYDHTRMNYSNVLVLRSVQPGVQEIPWDEHPGTEPAPEGVPSLERAPDGRRFPTDGVGGSLAYPLEDAIRTVAGDPTLASYQSWVARNPGRVLVGAVFGSGTGHVDIVYLGPEIGGNPPNSWTLAFGVPGGGAYVVETKKDLDTGHVANWDNGEARIQSNGGVLPDDLYDLLPERPVTLAQAQRFLRAAWGPTVVGGEGYDPSQIWWGFPILSEWGRVNDADATDQRPEVRVVEDELRRIRMGRGDYWPSRVPGSDAGGRDLVYIDAEAGILEQGRSESTWYNYEVPARAVDSLVNPPEPLASGPGGQASAIERLPLAGIAATSLFALFLVAYFYPVLKFAGTSLFGALPGYAKLHKAELLNNKIRDQLLQLIKADPGITPPQLQAVVQAGWSTIVYHLGVLEKNQVVSSLIDGRHKRFFPVGGVDHSKRGQVAALKNERTRQLYEIVLEQPGTIQKELIQRLGISQPSTMWHIKRLESAGLLGHDKQGRQVHYYASPAELKMDSYDPRSAVEVA